MTRLDLDELERKAREASTQDEWQWRIDATEDRLDVLEGKNDGQVVMFPDLWRQDESMEPILCASSSDRAHIAAASPPVALALIARIRELESEVDRAAGLLEASSDRAARKVWAAGLRESVAKGVVLP
jgi:hypothetical protein